MALSTPHGLLPLRTVLALNGLRRWILVLTALSANSPVWHGSDSGFAGWRLIQYRR
ncbi:glutamate-cysteine ligase family protein [Brevibacterium sp. FME37]|uniref:glutamate-cysteine ligase family protein n=1 Tax=Brevibacterium sp. FME37 TaxID=2742607 RepID=UPI0018660D12|nr:glutamate-cysteine ligase family protein [Brevibacterium sp. FME37]